MLKVGMVGTGMLGAAVASHLLREGREIMAYNRTRSKAEELASHGAVVAESPKDVAARCDVIITCVRDADAVADLAFGKDGIADSPRKDLTVLEMSTIHPAKSARISERYKESGITMLCTPVMGGPNVAIDGRLMMMVSGDRAAYERYRGLLDTIADRIHYLGSGSEAHAIKLAMNIQIASLALSISEGITLVRESGIDPKIFLDVLNSTYFATGMSRNKAYRMIQGSYEPTFTLKNLTKDLGIINDAADSLGISLPASRLAESMYSEAVKSGLGDIDYTGILDYIRQSDSGSKP